MLFLICTMISSVELACYGKFGILGLWYNFENSFIIVLDCFCFFDAQLCVQKVKLFIFLEIRLHNATVFVYSYVNLRVRDIKRILHKRSIPIKYKMSLYALVYDCKVVSIKYFHSKSEMTHLY